MERMIATDIHSVVTSRLASALVALTAGGTGDNTAIAGIALDRIALGLPTAADIVLAFDATLGEANTLSLKTVKIEDSADGNAFATYATFTDPGVVATGPSGGGEVTGQKRFGINLSSARRYVRAGFTPDLSATTTDTAKVAALLVLAGFDELPSPI